MTEPDRPTTGSGPDCNVAAAASGEPESVEERKTVQINGLRVYVKTGSAESPHDVTYYSRRADGPYYRWSYRADQWRCARVQSTKIDARALTVAKWKGLSPELQITIVDHYLE